MSDLDREIVACVDRLRQGLATLVVETVGQLVESVRERQAAEKKAAEQRIISRLERAADRRARAAQAKAARSNGAGDESGDGVEFKFRKRRGKLSADLSSLGNGANGQSRRSRRGGGELLAENGNGETGAAPEAKPAPLFVHKRTRDGQIQSLTRSAEEEAARAAASGT